ADDLAELALSNRQFAATGRRFTFPDQTQQRLGESGRQVEKGHILGLVGGRGQTCAKDLDHLHDQIGLTAEKWNEIPALDPYKLAVRLGRRVGGTRPPVEQL